jgi:hypothetical protein
MSSKLSGFPETLPHIGGKLSGNPETLPRIGGKLSGKPATFPNIGDRLSGTAEVIIHGKGGYKGQKVVTFNNCLYRN